jgi:hypothetical protein
VFVPCVTGNYGRNTLKIRAKGRNFTYFDWLIYQFLAKLFAHDARVQFAIPDGRRRSARDGLRPVVGDVGLYRRTAPRHPDAAGAGPSAHGPVHSRVSRPSVHLATVLQRRPAPRRSARGITAQVNALRRRRSTTSF